MNISTGGPHILIFERDQQLAALLTSELQIAGYECHCSRTAVEVFDAIARFPVRLVLINLAQAAASRREFWVALDTQRRGSGIQVFTFHCSNLAGYGPRDHDDYGQASMADMEIDGMLGLMKLVNTVRARVPGPEGNATTVPRIPRTPETPSTHDNRPSSVGRQKLATKMVAHSPTSTTSIPTTRSPHDALGASQPYPAPSPATQLPGGSQVTYSDKIRAVLTSPSRNTSQIEAGMPSMGGVSPTGGTRPQGSGPASSPGLSMLQRLANGQIYTSPGLAELSRLVQGAQLTVDVAGNHASSPGSPQDRDYQLRAAPIQDLPLQRPVSQSGLGYGTPAGAKPSDGVSHTKETQPDAASQSLGPINTGTEAGSRSLPPTTPNAILSARDREIEPATTTSREKDRDSSSTEPSHYLEDAEHSRQSNRAQDLSHQRGSSETPRHSDRAQDLSYQRGSSETPRHSDRAQDLSHQRGSSETPRYSDRAQDLSYQRGSSETPRQSDRAQDLSYQRGSSETPRHSDRTQDLSYQRGSSETPRQSDRAQDLSYQRGSSETPRYSDRAQNLSYQRGSSEISRYSNPPEVPHNLREDIESLRRSDPLKMPLYPETQNKDIEERLEGRNAVILDILQSLPAVATPSGDIEQALQPQVHNGRATRSLGNVLLDGHLVPQDRLEVAQNIQRMLRGVDLNYQLGEILLMFKLLTPDQLLAATLVGYGLITRTQISALGRIRQELHAIGLEYDLENLVILFRILTPEQLREARSSVLG
jgi:hypothetical protein